MIYFSLIFHVTILVAFLALGMVVFFTNPRRVTNQCFLILSIVTGGWLGALVWGFHTQNLSVAIWLIRVATVMAIFIPCAFNALRVSIVHHEYRLSQVLSANSLLNISGALLAPICLTRYFLVSAAFPDTASTFAIPEPLYGNGILIYGAFHFFANTYVVVELFRGLRKSTAIQRIELQFILLASSISASLAVLFTVVLPLFAKSSQSAQYTPIAVLLFGWIIAYGIATRRILEVANVLRLATAYVLLAGYLITLYCITWWIFRYMGISFGIHNELFPGLVGAFFVVISLAPAKGWLQRFANRLFVGTHSTNVGLTVEKANEVFQSIQTRDMLLSGIAKVIHESVGVGELYIYLDDNGDFTQMYPLTEGRESKELRVSSPMLRALAARTQPVVVDVLHRRPETPMLAEAGRHIQSFGLAASVGIRTKSDIQGVILLGPRISGRIYGLLEVRALQIVADQLAVAIENAHLYTQLQDGKLYNEILLDSLVSGVIATDQNDNITVFNREAGRITGLSPQAMIGDPVADLPQALRNVLTTTLSTGKGVRNMDTSLLTDAGDLLPVQIGSSVFHGHEGALSGALLVVDDLSVVKKLQTQVRRTAHLASVGTLAAGMAHEIKNPLVTLKTFSQLLGEQYEDPEFRDTFSVLVGKEVNRIDRIVNELLQFGRPAKSQMTKIELRDVIEQSVQLVQVPLKKKAISLIVRWQVHSSTTAGDPKLLEQAFVNFFLNAIDAMEDGGDLSVVLQLENQPLPGGVEREDILPDHHLSVSICDSGMGIKKSDLAQVFDPFFTTKSTGTGLGLSVAHSIIQEHGGMIDVESEYGVGTTLHVLFPIVTFDASSNALILNDKESTMGTAK